MPSFPTGLIRIFCEQVSEYCVRFFIFCGRNYLSVSLQSSIDTHIDEQMEYMGAIGLVQSNALVVILKMDKSSTALLAT